MAFEHELRETPAVLRAMARRMAGGDLGEAVAAAAAILARTAPAPVLLSGMGSSHFAAHYAACLLEAGGRPAVGLDSGDLMHAHPAWLARGGAAVLISQSGRSGEILDLLEHDGKGFGGALVAITNEPQSPLGRAGDVCIELHAGPEEATSSKTYFASVAACALLAAAAADGRRTAAGEGLDAAAAALEGRLAGPPSAEGAALAEHLAAGRNLVFLGKGTGWCAAQQAALIAQEAAGAVASGATYGQWRHGPSERSGPGVVLAAVPTAAADAEVERTLGESEARGAQIVRLPGQGLPPWRLALDPIVPVYEALLAVGRARGHEVGRLSHKVTGR